MLEDFGCFKFGYGICSRKLQVFFKIIGILLDFGRDRIFGFVILSDCVFRIVCYELIFVRFIEDLGQVGLVEIYLMQEGVNLGLNIYMVKGYEYVIQIMVVFCIYVLGFLFQFIFLVLWEIL